MIDIQNQVWDIPRLAPRLKFLLLRLADHADSGGRCWPSVPHLAQKCGVADRTVQRWLNSLEKLGHIRRKFRGWKSTEYHLNFTARPKATDNPLKYARRMTASARPPTYRDERAKTSIAARAGMELEGVTTVSPITVNPLSESITPLPPNKFGGRQRNSREKGNNLRAAGTNPRAKAIQNLPADPEARLQRGRVMGFKLRGYWQPDWPRPPAWIVENVYADSAPPAPGETPWA